MPRIPVATEQQELRAAPNAQQSPQASAAAFGTQGRQLQNFGNALEGAASTGFNIAKDMQDRENADMLFRAETALRTDYMAFENGIREKRGQNAWGVTAEADGWFKEAERKYSEGLGNDLQRRLFAQQVGKLRGQAVDSISGYEAAQRRESLVESAQASITSSINLAAANANDPAAVAATKGEVLKRTQVLASINGWSPELRAAKESEVLTNLHKQVIGAMVDSNPAGAKAYFETNREEISGGQRMVIDKALREGSLKTIAQEAADALMAMGDTEAAALEYARSQYSGDEESAVVAEIKTRYAEQTVAREREQKTAADDAFGIYARTGRISAIPAETLARMDGRTLLALRKDAETQAAGTTVKTDWDTYYALRRQALDEPEKFARRDLRAEFPKLGKTEREGLIDLQTKISKPEEFKEAQTFTQQLGQYHNQLGLNRANQAEKRGLFDRVATDAIQSEEKARGKRLTYEERQKLLDRLVVDGEIEGSGMLRDDRGRLFEFQGREDVSKFTPRVPRDERGKIEAALKRAGRPVTDAEVTRLYKKKMGLE